jgi:FkbM family methyltransferase
MPYPHSYLGRALRTAFRLWAGGNRLHYVLGTLMRDSARIIVLSSPHRARLLKHDPHVAEKTVILPPPPLIRFSQVSPATARAEMREAIGVGEGELVLMYWGFIYPGKGLETLIQAFQAVALRHAGVRLVVVGGMLDFPTAPISCVDYYRHARTLPETLGIADRVTWTGPFDWDSDVGSRYLHAGDIVVLPFDYGVTLNNSTLAAATTHGLPVIGTTLPIGHDEGLEHSRNIYLVPPKDAPALTDAIVRVITSPELRETLRQGSVALAASSHRWDVMTERLTEVLESAIASRRAPSAAIAASAPAAGNALLEAAPRAPAQVWTEQNAADAPDAPLVSVVVAVYNVRKYLSQCLDSLVNQTLADIEIVVVNDASEDDSATILEHYRSRYPVIRVVHCEQNVGLASVRNRGMAAARGRYVAFMDGDDWADVYMCEALYRRALEHRADVVIADTNVFYDDRKAFTAFFDQALRATFDPKVRTMPFQILSYPRVMLVEPVAWTKLYRRAFLHEHQLQFEEGMNSYEDMIFHFSTLLKAARVSFIDDRISFYRQNRPGQISGRTSRKVFEVFDVFDRIHENLQAWGVPEEIWAVLVKVELRQFNWLMKDRVRDEDKREFLGLASKQMNRIPQSGYWAFIRRADPDDVPILTALRRNWLSVYLRMLRLPPGMSGVVFAPLLWKQRPDAVKGAFGKGVASLRHRGTAPLRAFLGRVMAATTTELQRSAGGETLPQTAGVGRRGASGTRQPPVKAVTVAGQQLFFRDSLDGAGLDAAVSRVSADYYLARTAVFRTGDTVVDVGAHVGVFSLWLATLYPFITVYAVEPDPGNHAALRENIALNDLQNVVLIDRAVAADSRARTLYSDAIDSGKATLDRNLGFTYGLLQTAQVETTSVRELFRHHGIERCRLLKISAPGAVRDVLQGLAGARTIDLVCGEVDLAECRLGEVETISEVVARQHFWRTIQRHDGKTVHGWMHRLPEDLGE